MGNPWAGALARIAPIDVSVDVTDAPHTRGWAEAVVERMRIWHPAVCLLLASPRWTPPAHVVLRMRLLRVLRSGRPQ